MNQELLHTPQAMAEIPNTNQCYFSRNQQLVGLFTNTRRQWESSNMLSGACQHYNSWQSTKGNCIEIPPWSALPCLSQWSSTFSCPSHPLTFPFRWIPIHSFYPASSARDSLFSISAEGCFVYERNSGPILACLLMSCNSRLHSKPEVVHLKTNSSFQCFNEYSKFSSTWTEKFILATVGCC